MKRLIGLTLIAILAFSCGPRKKPAPAAPATRDFPMAEIPMMITEPQERALWLAQHFWDRFTATDKAYLCDSLTVNGVVLDNVEKQVGLFASILQQVPLGDGQRAMSALYSRLRGFQEAFLESNMLPQVTALVSRYFYDPNSPVRSEDLYRPFVDSLSASPLLDADDRRQYAWESGVCALNGTGTPAADFKFVDTSGRTRTLYSVKAEWTLLIFGNPDCNACREIMEQMDASPEITALISSGRLKVVDIYIDEDLELWKARWELYPKAWINGYDPTFTIRTDRIYAVRAVPSLYLLDRAKTVIMKDALPEHVLAVLEEL